MEDRFLQEFARTTKEQLGINLSGIYLHGSLAMGSYVPGKSDVDLLIVIQEDVSLKRKRTIIEKYMELENQFPSIKLEMSIVLERFVKQFEHPTPFVLHYSSIHKDRYQSEPEYVCGNALDVDLAAHFMITYERGICLFGKPVRSLFQPVPREAYLDSILSDVREAEKEILIKPDYYVLNLCRVLYYIEEEVISSKKEAGDWGIGRIPEFANLLRQALQSQENSPIEWNEDELRYFAHELLKEISLLTHMK